MKSKQDESKLATTAADLRNLSDIALVQLKRAHDAQRDLLFDIQASLNRTSCPSDLDQAESVAWLVTEVERLHHLEALLNQAAAEVTTHTFTAGGVAGLRAELANEGEKVSLLREACERLRGYDRLDIGLGDLHSFVNETVTDVLAATADVK